MADNDDCALTDRQMTQLVVAIGALGSVVDGQSEALEALMDIAAQPQANLQAAYTALVEAAAQLKDAEREMWQAQRERESARKAAEAARTSGCQHVLAVYPGKDGQYSVIGCERCHTRIEVDMDALREGDSAAVDALFASVEKTFGIPRALLSALAFQGTTLRGFDDWTGLMGTTDALRWPYSVPQMPIEHD